MKNLRLSPDSATNGELTGDSTNGWSFKPNQDFNGTVELAYEVEDSMALLFSMAQMKQPTSPLRLTSPQSMTTPSVRQHTTVHPLVQPDSNDAAAQSLNLGSSTIAGYNSDR